MVVFFSVELTLIQVLVCYFVSFQCLHLFSGCFNVHQLCCCCWLLMQRLHSINCVVVVGCVQYGAQLRENLRLILKCDDTSRTLDNGTSSNNVVSRVVLVKQLSLLLRVNF